MQVWYCNDAMQQKKKRKNATTAPKCWRGNLPPVDLRAVCLVRAIVEDARLLELEQMVVL